jgi:hypothetical protein
MTSALSSDRRRAVGAHYLEHESCRLTGLATPTQQAGAPAGGRLQSHRHGRAGLLISGPDASDRSDASHGVRGGTHHMVSGGAPGL